MIKAATCQIGHAHCVLGRVVVCALLTFCIFVLVLSRVGPCCAFSQGSNLQECAGMQQRKNEVMTRGPYSALYLTCSCFAAAGSGRVHPEDLRV